MPKICKDIWKDIKGYEGIYQINNFGSIKKGYTLKKATKNHAGYLSVGLWKEGKIKGYRINRLVAETFIDNPNKYPCVCHKDGNKLNNKVSNLYWGTHKMNEVDKKKHGTWLGNGQRKGSNNPSSKLNDMQVRVIKHILNIPGHMLQNDLSRIFKVSPTHISGIKTGKFWGHITVD